MKAVVDAKDNQRSVADIARAVKLSQPKVSDHLKLMRIQKVVAATPIGTRMDYRIKDPVALERLGFID